MSDEPPLLGYRARDAAEAHALAAALFDAGVESRIVGEMLDSGLGALGTGTPSSVEVWLKPSQADAARPILLRWRIEHGYGSGDEEGRLGPLRSDQPPLKLQFSLRALWIVGTMLVVFFGLLQMRQEGLDRLGVVLSITFWIGMVVATYLATVRRRRESKACAIVSLRTSEDLYASQPPRPLDIE